MQAQWLFGIACYYLGNLAIRAVSQFPDGLHVAFDCPCDERSRYLTQSLVVCACCCNLHVERIAEWFLAP